jgi:hypothetical protein
MIRIGRKERKQTPIKHPWHPDNTNYELIALAVTILAAMGAGFAWLSHQMKDVRDELKADIKDVRDELKVDIKRVEDKLDNKE